MMCYNDGIKQGKFLEKIIFPVLKKERPNMEGL